MKEALVSVIVPVYNVAPYLKEALDSVVNQTYRNLEIIIIDDGSTDGSETICDEYKRDSRVRVIHQQNRGLSGARNAGLDIMTGDFAAFLDSDDYYYPDMISKMVEEADRNNADIVICAFDWNEKKYGNGRRSYNSIEALKMMISGKMELAVWNKIYKHAIWNGIRFPEGHNYEGTRTTYKLLEKAEKIEEIPECLMFHRTRSDSIVQTQSKKNLLDFFLACDEYEGYVKANTPEKFTQEEYNRFCEKRFRAKLKNWDMVEKLDTVLAKKDTREHDQRRILD